MPPKKAQSSAGNHHTSAATPARRAVNGGGSIWHWTNERHVRFLNNMEASFVESMFGGGGNGGAAAAVAPPPPLDRYLPDTAESTQDLAKERRTRHCTASASGSRGRMDKKTRNFSCQKSSQDQVVPQVDIRRNDDKDNDDEVHWQGNK
ncbi:uncharacterized protein LOC127256480 isoform X2 [Andrographis paniculata]|uniref:uncharacterized protein LOC127256480 isoform X2 n=1 Tax=Andrographis paniculata TaxID=175694 RepID=UPI0021E983A4|nr:uncharacterized protein LOC127256480 isoform X2 [Andrographis paniculata]